MFLDEWLTANKISRQGLAKHLGCSPAAIKKWVYGEREPRWDQREQIMVLTKHQVTPLDWHENRRAYEAWKSDFSLRKRRKRAKRRQR